MHRSTSTTRVSEEFSMNTAAQAMGGAIANKGGGTYYHDDHYHHHHSLPTYDPQSDAAKKEVSRAKVAENMVHVIPFVLVLCTIILWFFSHPSGNLSYMTSVFCFSSSPSSSSPPPPPIPTIGIDTVSKEETVVAKVKNMTTDGYNNWNGSSMTIGMEDLDPIDGISNEDDHTGVKDSHH
ncbi:hypothetical protein BHM03_00042501 [Ensete ventricosum]|nr:hypothetical protein BHM03_00042501 [Ensete ventricosum]